MPRSDIEKQREQLLIAKQYQQSVANKRQQRDGVVITPIQVVDFQIKSILHLLEKQRVPLESVEWLDPFGGTGVYTARLLQLAKEKKALIANNCVVIEIDRHAAQICANNLAQVLYEETGIIGQVRVICTDTFALNPSIDLWDESLQTIQPEWSTE
jgi:predicted helicase